MLFRSLSVIADHAETSILLASLTMVWVLLIGVPTGMVTAMRHVRIDISLCKIGR